ncbi:type II toxin-antitoxin system VapC family toxin [Leadbetterella sp. DM7]|uniref:type II toxin-antitoxin system VapC family toxin n=1 Tax=Leadbetterella sp. DM7 TaxID=3235085 RepID=UPI00349E4BD8
MKLFVDANVIVSVLNHELPVFPYSSRILSLSQFDRKYILATTPICLAIAFYFSEKKCGQVRSLQKIRMLTQYLEVLTVGSEENQAVYSNPMIRDYEDGLQYYAARHAGCDYIITEDKKGFYYSEIPVCTSREYLLNYM